MKRLWRKFRVWRAGGWNPFYSPSLAADEQFREWGEAYSAMVQAYVDSVITSINELKRRYEEALRDDQTQ